MGYYQEDDQTNGSSTNHYRDELYTKKVRAGKRTYYFDVRATRSGEDFFVTITESKRENGHHEKHKLFLFKEDFGDFVEALHEVIHHIREERLPEYDFEDLPELTGVED